MRIWLSYLLIALALKGFAASSKMLRWMLKQEYAKDGSHSTPTSHLLETYLRHKSHEAAGEKQEYVLLFCKRTDETAVQPVNSLLAQKLPPLLPLDVHLEGF